MGQKIASAKLQARRLAPSSGLCTQSGVSCVADRQALEQKGGGSLPKTERLLRNHNAFAIAALNLITGWTLVGWVVALIWALTTSREEE